MKDRATESAAVSLDGSGAHPQERTRAFFAETQNNIAGSDEPALVRARLWMLPETYLSRVTSVKGDESLYFRVPDAQIFKDMRSNKLFDMAAPRSLQIAVDPCCFENDSLWLRADDFT